MPHGERAQVIVAGEAQQDGAARHEQRRHLVAVPRAVGVTCRARRERVVRRDDQADVLALGAAEPPIAYRTARLPRAITAVGFLSDKFPNS